MSTITIRKLDDRVKQVLRERAAARGVSMEQEVRDSLREVTIPKTGLENGAWRLKASRDEILALGRKLENPFDPKVPTTNNGQELASGMTLSGKRILLIIGGGIA
ncbi:MAG: bifunctional phosphopantothenoylcysteine decarboxylase/phosphopantothenate synthase, partial [Mesorhizobium sp.]